MVSYFTWFCSLSHFHLRPWPILMNLRSCCGFPTALLGTGYLAGKHIVLFIVALLILVVCIAYSFLLLCWQLILKLPNWKVFKFFKHPSFVLFMEAYHLPYTPKHRYWTGLLLLACAIISLISAANVSGDPRFNLSLLSSFWVASSPWKCLLPRRYSRSGW